MKTSVSEMECAHQARLCAFCRFFLNSSFAKYQFEESITCIIWLEATYSAMSGQISSCWGVLNFEIFGTPPVLPIPIASLASVERSWEVPNACLQDRFTVNCHELSQQYENISRRRWCCNSSPLAVFVGLDAFGISTFLFMQSFACLGMRVCAFPAVVI